MAETAAALRDLSDDALVARLLEEKDTLLKLRFRMATGQLDNTSELGKVRRHVARIMTELRAREIAAHEALQETS
ncbi:MAG: 50S ribosomal protein L29 [Acidimicrobiales bacterium]